MRKISRSSYEAFNVCPRKHYYNYEFAGTGVEAVEPSIDLTLGLGVHKGMELLLQGTPPQEAARAGVVEFLSLTESAGTDMRWNTMRREGERLIWAFVNGFPLAHPEFFTTFTVVDVEKEVRVQLSGDVVLMARADAVVRDLNGSLWVVNHKTCSSWDGSDWMYDVQMWTEALAMEQHYGEPVHGCLVTGFLKGGRRSGVLSTPLIYKWVKGEREKDLYEAGGEKVLLSEEEILSKLERLDLAKHFPLSPPVMRNDAVVEAWLDQVVRRESENAHMLSPEVPEEDRLQHFWQRFTKWNCPFCPFKDVCYGVATIGDMVRAGKLRERVDHHAVVEEITK